MNADPPTATRISLFLILGVLTNWSQNGHKNHQLLSNEAANFSLVYVFDTQLCLIVICSAFMAKFSAILGYCEISMLIMRCILVVFYRVFCVAHVTMMDHI